MNIVKRTLAFLVLIITATPCLAKMGTPDLRRVEAYLDNVRTLQATFRQLDPDGRVLKGTFYLSRPGKMRLKYAPPQSQVIIADGNFLIYNNPDLDEITQIPLDSTPAQFILQDRIRFQEDARVVDFKERGGKIYLSLVNAQDPDSGKITLIFRAQPLQLQEWIMMDPNQRPTHVVLEDVRTGVSLDPQLFVFDRPRF